MLKTNKKLTTRIKKSKCPKTPYPSSRKSTKDRGQIFFCNLTSFFKNQGEEVTARQLWFSRPDFKLDQDDIDAIQALYGPPKVCDIQCSL